MLTQFEIGLVGYRLNRVQNAYRGGHFAIFLSLLLIIGMNILRTVPELKKWTWTIVQIVDSVQTGLALILLLVYGSWSDRNLDDDEENVRCVDIDFTRTRVLYLNFDFVHLARSIDQVGK